MKKTITLLILVLAGSQITGAQTKISNNDKLYVTAKLWGFLKYYHPQVAKGKTNWDQQLFNILDKTKAIDDKEALSAVYLEWINSFGLINPCKKCRTQTGDKVFDKNFDLSWIQDQKLFSPALSEKLKYIQDNRFQGKPYYYGAERTVNIKIKHEPEYPKADWTDEHIRLLSLFRYWNYIEYFFPYKYQTDQNWDNVLTEMIPKFLNPETEQQYHLAILELVVQINDSHAGFVTDKTNNYFGYLWAPVYFKIIDQKAVIIRLTNDTLAAKDDLRVGDVIEKVNGKKVSEILSEKMKYINGSNQESKLRNAYYSILNGNTGTAIISVERDGVLSEKTIHRYDWNKTHTVKNTPPDKWHLMAGNIGYVNMGLITIKEVPKMIKDFAAAKAIIFDIRNYPNRTFAAIAKYLYEKPQSFADLSKPDLHYPGKFILSHGYAAGPGRGKNPYKGKSILLVNEETQSQAEWTAMCIQAAPNVTTIGSQTSGADGNVSTLEFPGGYKSLISGFGVFYPDGTETQRKGVKIDVEVKPTIKGIREGRDEVLEKAIEVAGG